MRYVILTIICMIVWIMLTFSLELSNIIVGISVSFLTAIFFGRYFVKNTSKFIQPHRYFWLIIYLIVFLWECLKANFDVAYRVLHPAMPIRPGIVKPEFCNCENDACQFHYDDSGNIICGFEG
jgi:multicomponent Na+:H+ antiporter subunit E